MRDVVIVDSVRTGLAKSFRGTFNLTRPDDMVAHCIDALLDRNPQIDPAEVEDVIVGAASQTGEQGGNIAPGRDSLALARHHRRQHDFSCLLLWSQLYCVRSQPNRERLL